MPQLPVVQHEKFAQAMLTSSSATEAYEKVYGKSANSYGPASVTNRKYHIRERALELLRENNADLPQIQKRFAHWLNDDEHPAVSMDAVKTGLRIYGVLDDDSASPIDAITINIVTLDPSLSSGNEDTDNANQENKS